MFRTWDSLRACRVQLWRALRRRDRNKHIRIHTLACKVLVIVIQQIPGLPLLAGNRVKNRLEIQLEIQRQRQVNPPLDVLDRPGCIWADVEVKDLCGQP